MGFTTPSGRIRDRLPQIVREVYQSLYERFGWWMAVNPNRPWDKEQWSERVIQEFDDRFPYSPPEKGEGYREWTFASHEWIRGLGNEALLEIRAALEQLAWNSSYGTYYDQDLVGPLGGTWRQQFQGFLKDENNGRATFWTDPTEMLHDAGITWWDQDYSVNNPSLWEELHRVIKLFHLYNYPGGHFAGKAVDVYARTGRGTTAQEAWDNRMNAETEITHDNWLYIDQSSSLGYSLGTWCGFDFPNWHPPDPIPCFAKETYKVVHHDLVPGRVSGKVLRYRVCIEAGMPQYWYNFPGKWKDPHITVTLPDGSKETHSCHERYIFIERNTDIPTGGTLTIELENIDEALGLSLRTAQWQAIDGWLVDHQAGYTYG